MPYMPDDDEGEIRFGLIDAALCLVVAALVLPGVIWWIGTLVGATRAVPGAIR